MGVSYGRFSASLCNITQEELFKLDGIPFGLICDNNFYLTVTEPGKALLKEMILRPPYDGAKDYFYITDVDDRDYLVGLIKATLPALPKPNARQGMRVKDWRNIWLYIQCICNVNTFNYICTYNQYCYGTDINDIKSG